MPGKFELYRDKGNKFRFRLKATNGQIILASQGYATKTGAANGIEAVKKNAPEDARFLRKTATNGKFTFNLRAGNHQVIGTSELYDTEKARDKGVASVMKAAPGAKVDDQTEA